MTELSNIAAMYRRGFSICQVAEHHGTTYARVRTTLIEAGVPIRPPCGGPRQKVRLPDRAELARLYLDEGLSLRAIAERCGASPGTVRDGLARERIPIRSRGRRPAVVDGSGDSHG